MNSKLKILSNCFYCPNFVFIAASIVKFQKVNIFLWSSKIVIYLLNSNVFLFSLFFFLSLSLFLI